MKESTSEANYYLRVQERSPGTWVRRTFPDEVERIAQQGKDTSWNTVFEARIPPRISETAAFRWLAQTQVMRGIIVEEEVDVET